MLLFIVNSVFKVNYYKDFVTTEWMMAQDNGFPSRFLSLYS